MKKLFGLLFISASLSLVSCGGDSKDGGKNGEGDSTEVDNGELDLTGMQEHDMSGVGLNVKLMVAEEMSPNNVPFPVVDSVLIEGISWMVCVGEKYCITLEEADGSGKYLDKEKKRLESTGIFDLKYLVEKGDAVLYEATLKNEAGTKPFYHVFGVVKIEGKDFILKSSEAGEFNKGQAERMYKTIQALKKGA